MKVTFAPKGILQIDDARIIWANFSGKPGQYNREGDRSFNLVIDDPEIANAMIEEGWNVRIKPPREEGDESFMHMPVKVKFNSRGPAVYLESGTSRVKLDEESIDTLDHIDIIGVDMDIRPYDWEINGKTGRTAYLQSIRVVQRVDRFADRWDDEEDPFDL